MASELASVSMTLAEGDALRLRKDQVESSDHARVDDAIDGDGGAHQPLPQFLRLNA